MLQNPGGEFYPFGDKHPYSGRRNKMNIKTLSVGIVATAIMILLASSVLIPIVSEAQKVAGDPVLFSSSGQQTAYAGGYNPISPSVHVEYDITPEGININGEHIEYSSAATWGAVVIGEGGTCTVRIQTYGVQFRQYDGATEITLANVAAPQTVILDGSTLTMGDYTFDVGEGYYLDLTGDYSLAVGLTERAGTWYVNSINDVTVYGIYLTGENDTAFALKNGVVTTAEEYDSHVNYALSKVDGTTDVYTLSDFTIDIGGETFTPYNSIIIKNCYGHKDSGATYSLVGLIPILVIAGLVIGVIGMFVRNRD